MSLRVNGECPRLETPVPLGARAADPLSRWGRAVVLIGREAGLDSQGPHTPNDPAGIVASQRDLRYSEEGSMGRLPRKSAAGRPQRSEPNGVVFEAKRARRARWESSQD
jgi:hypothetical protein